MNSVHPPTRAAQFWRALARAQTRHPYLFVLGGFAFVLGALPFVLNLGLNSDWTALLPASRPSVRDLEAVRGRLQGLSTLTVALESKNTDALKRFATDLSPRLQRLHQHGIHRVEWNIRDYVDFVQEHKYLYVNLNELQEIRDTLQERLDYERMRHNPFFVNLGEEAPPSPRALLQELQEKQGKRDKKFSFEDGFYLHPKRDFLAIFLRTDISGGNIQAADRLIHAIEVEVQRLNPKKYAADLQVKFGGDVVGAREEHEAIARELAMATSVTFALVLCCIYWLFRRFRSIALLGISLCVPVFVTFALAERTVGYLNASTAFLGSIVIGNGINPMIIWLARYFEEHRKGLSTQKAIIHAHQGTWAATLSASSAAAVAYGSLLLTEFRGFRDFGIIGGLGMVLSWLTTMFFLPAVTVSFERMRPLVLGRLATDAVYGKWLWRIVTRSPRVWLWTSVLISGVAALLTMAALLGDPLEYNFRNLRSTREESSRARTVNRRVSDMVSRSASGSGIAMLTSSAQETRWLKKELERRREAGAPWGAVRSLDDSLPKDQAKKVPLLVEIRQLLLQARTHAKPQDQIEIDRWTPPQTIKFLSIEDVPDSVARFFTEKDGTRGRMLFVEEKPGVSQWDGNYLLTWASALREVKLPNGSRPPLAGRAPIFADMLDVVLTDGPRVMLISFLLTLLLVIVTFRKFYYIAFTAGSLMIGVLWMMGLMAVLGIKINFLNFVAFPITFGIGVDYAVNVVRRFAQETEKPGMTPENALRASIEETGAAVMLCSLTTVIGYLSLFTSANQALNSFGIAMTISEGTCLATATLTLPALLLARGKNRIAKNVPN